MFVLGSVLGSFFYLLIERIPIEEDVIIKRSHCSMCQKNIVWYDLVPILSYLLLKGKCRYCKEPIPVTSFIMESFSAILCLSFSLLYSNRIEAMFYYLIVMIVLVMSIIDFQTKCVYHCFLISLFILGIIYQIKIDRSLVDVFISMMSVSSLLAITRLVSKQSVGMGDVLYYVIIGMFLSFIQCYISFWIATSLGYLYGTTKKQKEIPFVPFISIGFLCFLL